MSHLPGGEELSTEERIVSAVDFGFGSVSKAWSATPEWPLDGTGIP
jgi:hypothetical protein